MIQMIFEEEKKDMKTILNSKGLFQNFSYKIAKDLNSKHFFDNLISNIKNYKNLEHMQKYNFEKDLKEMREVLHLLYSGLQSDTYIKSKTSAEMIKSCNVFPDNIGKRMIIQISYIPIINLFYEDLMHQEFFSKKIDLLQVSCGKTMQEDQRERLFGKGLFHKKFPKDEEFIDFSMRNEFITELEKEYIDTRKEEINTALNILLSQYEDSEDLDKTTLLIGATYWDNKKTVSSKQTLAFKSALEAMSQSFKEKDDSLLTRLTLILKDELSNITPEDNIESLIIELQKEGEDAKIYLKTIKPLENDEVDKITKLFIIKSKLELTKIVLLKSDSNLSFEFLCDIELG